MSDLIPGRAHTDSLAPALGRGERTSQVAGGGEGRQVQSRGHLACGQLGKAMHGPHELQLHILGLAAEVLKDNSLSRQAHGPECPVLAAGHGSWAGALG